MQPVEDWTLLCARMRAEVGADWLDEAQDDGDQAGDGVGVVSCRGPSADFCQDEDEASDGEDPRQDHEDSMVLWEKVRCQMAVFGEFSFTVNECTVKITSVYTFLSPET